MYFFSPFRPPFCLAAAGSRARSAATWRGCLSQPWHLGSIFWPPLGASPEAGGSAGPGRAGPPAPFPSRRRAAALLPFSPPFPKGRRENPSLMGREQLEAAGWAPGVQEAETPGPPAPDITPGPFLLLSPFPLPPWIEGAGSHRNTFFCLSFF